jgi:hypothetical protein
MTKKIFSRVMWVGRATVFLVGLAVILALVFGVAVTALAGTGVGATFNLGKTNTVNALSRLEGSTLNSMLKIDQNGSGTALNLEVQNPTLKPPMLVNSSTKVTNLNSDQLDGQDSSAFLPANGKAADAELLDGKDSEQFFPADTYANNQTGTGTNIPGSFRFQLAAYCDSGDRIISGGHFDMDPGTTLVGSGPDWFHQGWQVTLLNDGTVDTMSVTAYCADFGTEH